MGIEQLLESAVRSDEPLPLYANIQGDDEGGVWLAEYMGGLFLGVDPSRYQVVSPDGEWLGTLELPTRFRVLDIKGSRVLGVLKDELDVESVAVYEIRMEPLGS